MKRLLSAMLTLVLFGGCAATGGTPSSGVATPQPTTSATTPEPTTQPVSHEPGARAGIELAAADLPRLTGTASDATSAGAAVNAFGLDLYLALLGKDQAANVVISPASVALALAMARPGARAGTATEMDSVMHDLGSNEHAAWVATLGAALDARTGTFSDRTGSPQQVTLRVVNAAFAQRGLALEQPYLDALATRFGAGLRLVDYLAAAGAARTLINGWVAGQTEQRIRELLAQGTLDAQTRLVLVNAIYLKAAWQMPFPSEATAPAPFIRLDRSTVDVPMMHTQDQYPYASGDGWRAVELPYVGGKLAMLVIVPDDLAAFSRTLDAQRLTGIADDLAPAEVNLGLPRFSAETQAELGEILAALGMPTAFTDAADFSGITTQEPLEIAAVIHQANIDVDEAGTEAAAATAVVMRATGMAAEPVSLTVDRPFLFALRDVETGAILFLGRIGDPSVPSGS